MGTLTFVRHGQASFGSENYDQLSVLGRQQSLRLGEYFRGRGKVFNTVMCGTLKRHLQTWQDIAKGMQVQMEVLPWPDLNEYDSNALIAAIHPAALPKPTTPELYRHHFRLLRQALASWMQGEITPAGMLSYAEFLAGVRRVLDHVRLKHYGENVLIVSSGGPISTAVGSVLETSPETTIELNLRIRNTAVSEFAFTPKRHMLVSYNHLPHLDNKEYEHWITYA